MQIFRATAGAFQQLRRTTVTAWGKDMLEAIDNRSPLEEVQKVLLRVPAFLARYDGPECDGLMWNTAISF